jgi:hypothetical protein
MVDISFEKGEASALVYGRYLGCLLSSLNNRLLCL